MRFILLTAFSFCWYSISAQENNNLLEVTLGIGNIQLQEKALNNTKHSGVLKGLDFSYRLQSKSEFIHKVSFSFTWGTLKSKYEEVYSSAYSHPSLSYSLAKSLSKRVNLGGYFSTNYQVMEFENWDDSHLYWFTSYELGPSIQFIPIERLFVQFSLPLLSLVSRSRNEITNKVDSGKFSDIFKMIHSDPVVATLFTYQKFDLQIAYKLIESKKVNLEIITAWNFSHVVLMNRKELTYSSIIPGITFTYNFN